MYESFSIIYDDMVKQQNQNAFYSLKNYLEEIQFKGKKLAELACGTGNMALMFAENGYEIYATDLSKDMIAKALEKKQYPNCKFEVKDMQDFYVPDKVDLIYCLLDGMSYIKDIESVKDVIRNVSRSLSDDGYYIFDYFSYDSYKKIYGELICEQKYVDIDDKNTIYWIENYLGKEIDVKMEIYEKLEQNHFKVFKEEQHQFMFEDSDIINTVRECFEILKIDKNDIRSTVYCKKNRKHLFVPINIHSRFIHKFIAP